MHIRDASNLLYKQVREQSICILYCSEIMYYSFINILLSHKETQASLGCSEKSKISQRNSGLPEMLWDNLSYSGKPHISQSTLGYLREKVFFLMSTWYTDHTSTCPCASYFFTADAVHVPQCAMGSGVCADQPNVEHCHRLVCHRP